MSLDIGSLLEEIQKGKALKKAEDRLAPQKRSSAPAPVVDHADELRSRIQLRRKSMAGTRKEKEASRIDLDAIDEDKSGMSSLLDAVSSRRAPAGDSDDESWDSEA